MTLEQTVSRGTTLFAIIADYNEGKLGREAARDALKRLRISEGNAETILHNADRQKERLH